MDIVVKFGPLSFRLKFDCKLESGQSNNMSIDHNINLNTSGSSFARKVLLS